MEETGSSAENGSSERMEVCDRPNGFRRPPSFSHFEQESYLCILVKNETSAESSDCEIPEMQRLGDGF